MSDKDEAMENFKGAINNTSRKSDNEKAQEDEKQQVKREDTSTKEQEENNEDEVKLTEEEQEQQEYNDKVRYDISDDLEDEDEEESNENNGHARKKSKSKKNEEQEDNEEENNNEEESKSEDDTENSSDSTNDTTDDQKDETDDEIDENSQSNQIDDDKDSASKSDTSSSSVDNQQNSSSSMSDNQNADKYRPNNTTSGAAQDEASMAESGASEVGAAEGATAGAETAGGAASSTAAAGGTAAAATAGAPLWLIILIIVAVILIIMILIGYISFFVSGVGLVREKLLKFSNSLWKGIQGFFVGDEDAQVDKESIINIADYLENMGYDLVNDGFLNTEGKNVTVEKDENGKEITKNARGTTILEREPITETENSANIERGNITKIKSKYITAYLTAENRTYIVANQNKNVASVFSNIWDWVSDDDFSSDSWGTGMIYIEGMSEETANSLGVDSDAEWGKSKNVKIDRENKKMIITKDKYVYQYDLDGWAGRYGMPIEFLLTLHLATRAPDFAYEVATKEEFDSKVHVALYEVGTSVKIGYKTEGMEKPEEINEENWSNYVSEEQWEAIQEYNNDDITTYTPIITKVVNHWFKNLDFANCYESIENDPNTTDDDQKFTYYYPYVGLGEENDVLAGDENLYVIEVRKKDVYQVSEPKVIDNSSEIKKMLLGATDEENSVNTGEKYFIYDGSPMAENKEERERDYIIKKIKLEDEEMGYTMNTRTFTYAFAILESVHSEDAEFILRDLKELFRTIGIDDPELNSDQGSDGEITPLVWPIKDYKPVVWDPICDADTSKVTLKHKSDSTLGFDKGIEFLMPADGQIVNITRNQDENGESSGDSIKIKFTGGNREDLEDMYMYISGIKVNEDVNVNDIYSAEKTIGETIEKDIIIVMTDNQSKSVYNVEAYLQPAEWSFETATEMTESNFQNDTIGNDDGENDDGENDDNTGNNQNNDSSDYSGSCSEEFYWYLAMLEGMPITTDTEFTSANGGVNKLSGETYITVGPGIYMHADNCQKFKNLGYYNFNQYSTSSRFPKDITVKVYMQNVEQTKRVIENYMQGYNLNQRQMEALVLTAFQRGTGSGSTLWKVLDAIKSGVQGKELMAIWTPHSLSGVRQRRYAEWYLFTYGKYINKDTNKEVTFTSNTPFTDMVNGIQSGRM